MRRSDGGPVRALKDPKLASHLVLLIDAAVRASNTGPNLTLRFEARSRAGLEAIREEVLGALRRHVAVP